MAKPSPKDRVLAAALTLLNQGSAAAGSLRQIGEEAGLHNSSLFHYFKGKAAIHDALAERVVGDAASRLAFLETDDPPSLDNLVDAVGDLAEHLAARPDDANYLLSALASGEDGALHGARKLAERGLLEPIWKWILRAREVGEIRKVRPQPTTLQLVGLTLVEPAWNAATDSAGLRPAARARRREIEAWIRGVLTPE